MQIQLHCVKSLTQDILYVLYVLSCTRGTSTIMKSIQYIDSKLEYELVEDLIAFYT